MRRWWFARAVKFGGIARMRTVLSPAEMKNERRNDRRRDTLSNLNDADFDESAGNFAGLGNG